jgi:short-subunit dehydrogenase
MSEQISKGTALVTGASTGIGAVYADRLARRGYDLILVARDEARLAALAETLRAETGVKVDILPADLTQKPDLLKVEQRFRDDPAITLLVNNAGVSVSGTVADTDTDKLETLIDLNILAVTRLASAAVKAFVPRGHGAIINLSSVLALAPELSGAAYSGSKAYVLNFTQVLERELAGTGVKVQAVLPGATRTEIWERSGTPIDRFPASWVMEAGELVDASLAGFDQGELVTIPSLPDPADWDAFTAKRLALQPNLSHDHAAARYGVGAA